MRSRLIPLALAVLLLLAGCLGPLQADGGTAAADDTGDAAAADRTISVSGTGEATADPDLAVLTTTVEVSADSADEARDAAANRSDTLVSALIDAGVDEDAITTEYYAVQPDYDHSGEERRVDGYTARHAFRVETTPDRAGELIDVAVDNGASRVDGVQFTLSDEKRAELREEAVESAVADAEGEASSLASAAGLELGEVRTLSTTGATDPYSPRYETASDAGAAETSVRPGPVSVTVTVQATYTAN
ncbi:SIMPL domain-containing protein [Haloprofundus halobius]|uniref:SIMPL domain-containing protein n=1 Tax=Haloprofundus halobius TaxID=2876194 RepID=UPI001CCB1D35|nr:SIMPL domain-containing protein [Haloprofundus halobius]